MYQENSNIFNDITIGNIIVQNTIVAQVDQMGK